MNQLHLVRKSQLIIVILFMISSSKSQSATLTLNNLDSTLRVPRDVKHFVNTYERGASNNRLSDRNLKPEESQEGKVSGEETNLGKRCTGCDTRNQYYRNSYDTRYDSRYEPRYDRRYDGRYTDQRYDTRRSSYDRYDDRDRYDPYDRYDRQRYYSRDSYIERQPHYDQYDPRERYYDRDGGYDRNVDRGIGYDNAGYDYRGYDRRRGYRPWDETYRGSSGWDSVGRGYYFATGKPENTGQWGTGYASSWGYGRGDERDRGWRDQGTYRETYRPRDYYLGSARGTSYLYGRPAVSTPTSSTISTDDGKNSVTDSPHDTSSTG